MTPPAPAPAPASSPVPADALDPLAALRGYHWPDPVSWWPPAPGWWLLALLVLGGLVWVIRWSLRAYRRGAARRMALGELAVLRATYQRDGDAAACLRGLSRLLRRFALVHFPRQAVAGLSGEAWLAFLDAQGGGGRFRDGPGRLLLDGPYRPPQDLPVAALANLVEEWIRFKRPHRQGGWSHRQEGQPHRQEGQAAASRIPPNRRQPGQLQPGPFLSASLPPGQARRGDASSGDRRP